MKWLLLNIFIFLGLSAFSQSKTQDRLVNYQSNKLILPENEIYQSDKYFEKYQFQLGLSVKDSLVLKSVFKHKNDIDIERYQHFHNGIEVVGSEIIIHYKDNYIVKSISALYPEVAYDIKRNINLKIDEEYLTAVLSKSMSDFSYSEIKPGNWHFEDKGLCLVDSEYPDFSGTYLLSRKLHLTGGDDTDGPLSEIVFIDAFNGKMINHISDIHFDRVKGIANTRYYGEKEIYIDSLGEDQYLLKDDFRHVYTLDSDRDTFENNSAYWNQINESQNEVAGDVHFGASSYHEMMKSHFGWEGLDGNGSELTSVVHARGKYYVNAYWDGKRANFGNGDCDRYNPLTTLDIVGHEFVHGLTDHTSDLVYRNESGALNESISDIFGKALEFYYDPSGFNWLLGDKIRKDDSVNYFRSMADPSLRAHPKYYNGLNWRTGTSDNGGVHSNSGVFNYWFYLLVEGETGINEKSEFYSVDEIGMDKALQIVFLMQSAYLTSSSDYIDAFNYSLEACNDLYGPNSNEYNAVVEAWKAVGLFDGFSNLDLSLEAEQSVITICQNAESVLSYWIRNTGLEKISEASELRIKYFQSGGLAIEETIILDRDMLPRDSLYFQFTNAVNASTVNNGLITTELFLDGEFNMVNNNITSTIYISEEEDFEIVLESADFITEDVCGISEINRFRYRIRNIGCETIHEDDTIYFDIITDKGSFTLERRVFFDFVPGILFGSTSGIAFEQVPKDFSVYEVHFRYGEELNTENNITSGNIVFREFVKSDFLEDFEGEEYSSNLEVQVNENFIIDTIVDVRSNRMLALASNSSGLVFRNCEEDIDFFNQFFYKATLSFCVDTRGLESPVFSLDMMQLNNSDQQIFLINPDYSTMLKVRLDDPDFSEQLIYGQQEGELIRQTMPLPFDYTGLINIDVLSVSMNPNNQDELFFGQRDIVLLDELRIYDEGQVYSAYEGTSSYIIYPNPSNALTKISNANNEKEFSIFVYDNLGRLILFEREIVNQTWIDMSKLEGGVYFVNIYENNDFILSKRLVKF